MIIIWIILACGTAIIAHRIGSSVSAKRKKRSGVDAFTKAILALLDGDNSAALNFLKQSIKEQPQQIEPFLRLGDVLRETGEINRAIQIHRELTVRTGIDKATLARVYLSLARDYSKGMRLDRAMAVYEKALEIDPENEKAMEELLKVCEDLGEWEKAYSVRREISRIRKADDTRMLALYKANTGKFYLDKGDLKSAESNLKDALRIDSDCVAAYLHLGDYYYQAGEIDSAISAWRRLVTMFPQIAYITFSRLEKAFYEKGRYEKIVDLYNDLLERNPRDVRTLMNLANIHRKKGNFDEAIRLCQTAIEIDPSSRRVKQALARLYYEKGETERSLMTMVEALNGFSADEENYTCRNCGYRSNEVLWRCPRCRAWETFVSDNP